MNILTVEDNRILSNAAAERRAEMKRLEAKLRREGKIYTKKK